MVCDYISVEKYLFRVIGYSLENKKLVKLQDHQEWGYKKII
jgi:hypothetical protein